MGLLRAIFRIGQEPDAVPDNRPVYPPEDEFTFGFEEVFVTLALFIISYLVLSTPCFSIRGRGSRLNAGGWMDVMKRLRYVRSRNDFKVWWQQLRRQHGVDDPRNFDPQKWDELIRSTRQLSDDDYDMDKTVRATGGGRSEPSTPLRSFFRPLKYPPPQPQRMKVSSSDGYLADSPTKLTRFSTAENEKVAEECGEGGESFYEEDFRPETDHDRFEKAWRTQIRFAEYRKLVLPPECKLVEFKTTSQWRELEQSLLENLLNESRWKRIISYVRNTINTIYGIFAKLLSKESTARLSSWLMDAFRYRIRKQRGLSVDEDDETDDDDDGSVATLASSIGRRIMKTPPKSTLPEETPVMSNKKYLRDSVEINEIDPPLLSVPQIAPRRADSGRRVPQGSKSENENDASIINIPQSASVEKNEDRQTDKSPLRDRFGTADNDDATFVSAAGMEHADASKSNDIPSSVERSPKKRVDVSPLPMKSFQKLKKKDALENYRKPDIAPITIPRLKSNPEPEPKVSPMPSPKLKPKDPSSELVDTTHLNFFDTATSDRQLRDMTRAVPIPDSNGYILGDEFLGSSYTPLLVFVNSRSGPQQGNLLITQLRRLLNPIQVWDLALGPPEKILKSFSVLSRFQILVCGGDGTVSWIISALEKMGLKRWPPIAILPLGTGNDLARIHGWSAGYNNESLLVILRQISDAYISMLDLWELDITSKSKKGKKRKESKSFMNYLGVGVDAQAALQVHNLRESKPTLFFSRFFNKAWYAIAGGEEAIKSSCANLSQQIILVADGVEIPLPHDSQGIIFLNIDSYSGGVPMWAKGLKPQMKRTRRYSYSEGDFLHANGSGLRRNDSIEDLAELETSRELTACDRPSSCQDGLLDVVSIRGAFHLGQIRVGLSNAQLLCQCREASVKLKKRIALQIDGEPWRQNPSTLKMTRKPERATMLNRSAEDSGGVESEVTKLLNWANEKEVIDRTQYAVLMEEFSRRIEYKKRSKEQGNGRFSLVS